MIDRIHALLHNYRDHRGWWFAGGAAVGIAFGLWLLLVLLRGAP